MLVQDKFEIEDGVLKTYLAGTETDVVVPDGVTAIGEGVFKGMSWLRNVTLPSTVTKIEATAFKGCRQLERVNIPAGLTSLGEYAFHKCHALTELFFPASMTSVGGCAFLYCDSLKKVVMEGPTRFGKAVFSHNLSLREVAVNENLDDSNFSDEVFEGCINLEKITLSGKTYEVGNLIAAMDSHADYPSLIKSVAKSVYHSMQIENGVLTKFTINLKKIDLPEGITAIGKGCFFDKKGVVGISLPASLKEIKSNAFLNCIGLEEVIFKSKDVILDKKAFRGCSNLKKVTVVDKTFILEEETDDSLAGRVRDQVLGDFYISGRILVRYMGNEEQIQIPCGVEIIGERCFFGKEQLKTVICSEGVTEIREEAFSGCLTLQNVVLPNSLKRVEREAFAECKKLLKCNLPGDLEYIGEYAFRRCFLLKPFEPWPEAAEIHPYAFYLASLFTQPDKHFRMQDFSKSADTSTYKEGEYCAPYANAGNEDIKVLMLSGLKRIGKYAFSSCPNLEEIELDAPECVIERNAFENCKKLKKAKIHAKEIGSSLFAYCRSLKEVNLSGITALSPECFNGCFALSKLEAGKLMSMDARCFDECVNLDSFDFSGASAIGERAFERCDSLKSIKLSKTTVGYHAFCDCAFLESVEITEDTVLKSGAFIGCTGLKYVIFEGKKYEFSKFSDSLNYTDNPYPLKVREVMASVYSCFDIREGKTLTGYLGDAVSVTVPEDIEEIGQDVFRDHARLREINIPSSVKIFGSHAFSQTAWLADMREKSVFLIVNNNLIDAAMCKGHVVLPPEVKRVSSWAFAGNTEITELTIPSEKIAIEALSFRNCLNLKKITDWDGREYTMESVTDLKDKGYPELIQRIFAECINCFKLDSANNLIESTGNITNLIFPGGINSVGENVYKDCHLLETIVFSNETESIGKAAFENSKWLRSVKNAGTVSKIGAQAFSGCQSLEEIDLSDELTEIGNRCFEHCGNLKEIHISNRLSTIPERAFFRCKSLKKLTIPASVKRIEAEAFAFCDGLKEVAVSKDTEVAESAFSFCNSVKILRN
ncbi:MAG: leucine-rich repeat domain-containing protein [Lachnospiraceae bacterium]|nr:leucine-rich repeat domain-containing protein [Lachnospiraceae bacterium]